MANRTFKFYGSGYGNITVVFDGATIFSGDMPALSSDTADVYKNLFLFQGGEVPVTFQGTIPMEITVNSGTPFFGLVEANYTITPNPKFTTEQYNLLIDPSTTVEVQLSIIEPLATPTFTDDELAFISNPESDYTIVQDVLENHGVLPYIKNGSDVFTSAFVIGDCRSDIVINGEPQVAPVPRPTGQDGDWGWIINSPGVFTYNLNVVAGEE